MIPEYLPYGGRHRTLCDVLQEMRDCSKTLNFGPMLGLIEEAQSMGNHMESGLSVKKDYYNLAKILRNILESLRPKFGTTEEEM